LCLYCETPERAAQLEGLSEVRKALGPPGASERAAAIVLEEIQTAQAVRQATQRAGIGIENKSCAG